MKKTLFLSAAIATMATLGAGAQTVPVEATGWNVDAIAEATPASSHCTKGLDSQGWVFYTSNIQSDGSIGSADNDMVRTVNGTVFKLGDYATANVLDIPNGESTSLEFTSPVSCNRLALLLLSVNNDTKLKFTINYTDGTSDVSPVIIVNDWFGKEGSLAGLGRIYVGGESDEWNQDDIDYAGANQDRYFRLFEHSIDADRSKSVASLAVQKTGGSGHAYLFAVSSVDRESVFVNSTLQLQGIYEGGIRVTAVNDTQIDITPVGNINNVLGTVDFENRTIANSTSSEIGFNEFAELTINGQSLAKVAPLNCIWSANAKVSSSHYTGTATVNCWDDIEYPYEIRFPLGENGIFNFRFATTGNGAIKLLNGLAEQEGTVIYGASTAGDALFISNSSTFVGDRNYGEGHIKYGYSANGDANRNATLDYTIIWGQKATPITSLDRLTGVYKSAYKEISAQPGEDNYAWNTIDTTNDLIRIVPDESVQNGVEIYNLGGRNHRFYGVVDFGAKTITIDVDAQKSNPELTFAAVPEGFNQSTNIKDPTNSTVSGKQIVATFDDYGCIKVRYGYQYEGSICQVIEEEATLTSNITKEWTAKGSIAGEFIDANGVAASSVIFWNGIDWPYEIRNPFGKGTGNVKALLIGETEEGVNIHQRNPYDDYSLDAIASRAAVARVAPNQEIAIFTDIIKSDDLIYLYSYSATIEGDMNSGSITIPFMYVSDTNEWDDMKEGNYVVSWKDGNSGIEAVFNDGTLEIEAIYTIQGFQVATPVKGVNIIRYKDGSSRKVLVK